jgi:hypothetical protein
MCVMEVLEMLDSLHCPMSRMKLASCGNAALRLLQRWQDT